jgi:transposase
MAFYYCTCRENNPNATGTYRKVKVDREGICLNCGHYAVACTKEVTRGSDLFYELRVEEPKGDNYYVGEGAIHVKAEKVDPNYKPEFNPSVRSNGRKEKLTPEQKVEIKKLLPKYTQDKIGKIFNVSASVINKVAKQANFKYKRKGYKKLTDKQEEEIKNLLGNIKQDVIAKRYGVSRNTIYKIAKKNNIKKITRRLSDDQVREIRSLAETLSHREIAKMFNTSHGYIGRVVRRDTYNHVK